MKEDRTASPTKVDKKSMNFQNLEDRFLEWVESNVRRLGVELSHVVRKEANSQCVANLLLFFDKVWSSGIGLHKFSDGSADFKNYGYSVSLTNDGKTLAVSAPGPIVLDSNPNNESLPEDGARRVYVIVY